MMRRKIEPRMSIVLNGHICAPIEADVDEGATDEEIAKQVEPHVTEMVMAARDVLAELIVGLGTKGLVLRGTLTFAGHTETFGV